MEKLPHDAQQFLDKNLSKLVLPSNCGKATNREIHIKNISIIVIKMSNEK